MLRNAHFSTTTVTLYLLVYGILSQFQATGQTAFYLFLFSPVLLVWMVITVLKYGRDSGQRLDDREYGYQDRDLDEPGNR
jgi:hypothetical protein